MNYYKRINPLNKTEVYIGRTSGSIIARNHRDWADFHNGKLSKKLRTIYQTLYDNHTDFILELLETTDNSENISVREQYWIDKSIQDGETILNSSMVSDPNKSTARVVSRYSLDGVLLDSFPSILNASLTFKLNITNLIKVLTGKTKQIKGFMWAYGTEKTIRPYDGRLRAVEVHQYDLNGNYMSTFPSMESAGRAVGLKSGASIYYAATGIKKTAAKYLWRFSKEDNIKI